MSKIDITLEELNFLKSIILKLETQFHKKNRSEEYIKCATDFEYFAEKYCTIWSKSKQQKIPFKLLENQKTIYENLLVNDHVLINNSRQSGLTSLMCLYLAYRIIFTKNIKIAVVANSLKLAKESIFYNIIEIIENLPEEIFNKTVTKSSQKLKDFKEFNNGAQLQAFGCYPEGHLGYIPDILFVDEAAYCTEFEEFYRSSIPTMASGGQIILGSAPNGVNNLFYRIYQGSKEYKNGYKIIEPKWYFDRRFNEDIEYIDEKPTSSWYRSMCQTYNDQNRIDSELNNKFIWTNSQK